LIGWIVVDAGIKASSFDSGLPTVHSYPHLEYLNAGDEHGKIRLKASDNMTHSSHPHPLPFKVGDKLRLVPGHCDPTVNMYDHLIVIKDGHVDAIWPITARGAGQ
jgi:D-serine deaminase-like pyridoxal phosphate-dependent protein